MDTDSTTDWTQDIGDDIDDLIAHLEAADGNYARVALFYEPE